ncbi:hypothetical protein [Guptibacillus hwajinpoensis]|uniref:DUF4181 domain-containing protein n=1 Tax=Guptibacillus hwajinpoensis TaxID=208199 RepID=A0ABU0JZG7_9BACL|nr:hypothetical protein [Alkalihalobacillus hemicentroti]MDQ0482497.1 hypothetical protein [Alkalihalobacillus hemicentroti]
MKMDKDNLKKRRSKIVMGIIYIALIGSFVLLMFDSNSDNNLIATGLFVVYVFIRSLRGAIRERAEGNKKRALLYFGMSGSLAIAIIALAVKYVTITS